MKIPVDSLQKTEKLAETLAPLIKPGSVLALNGDLGAGKTTFIKALVKHSGSKEIVTSPTFVILNIYPGPKTFYHFDFYRLNSAEDVENIGGEEFIPPADGVTLIEWAEKIPEMLPADHLNIKIKFISDTEREFDFKEVGNITLLKELEKKWHF